MERLKLPYGASLKVKEGDQVSKGTLLAEWDPYSNVILADCAGQVQFMDIEEGVSMSEQVDPVTGFATKMIIKSKSSDQKPRVCLVDKSGKAITLPGRETPVSYTIPVGGLLSVSDGDKIQAGDLIAKIHKKSTKTQRYYGRTSQGGGII